MFFSALLVFFTMFSLLLGIKVLIFNVSSKWPMLIIIIKYDCPL